MPADSAGAAPARAFELEPSPGFAGWLRAQDIALAVTTYQIGKLFLVGADGASQLNVTERSFDRCLGVAWHQGSLYLAGFNAIHRFTNVVPPGQQLAGYDAVYIPRVAWHTGDVFAHDIGVLTDGRPVFANTLFSCLATVDETTSFRPAWMPPFLSQLAPQDRCHLNGLAMDQKTGTPRFMTAVAETDTPRGWSPHRVGGGVVLDLHSGRVVCRGLSMPHSPRLHEGRLYVLNAGTGELGEVDAAAEAFRPLAFLPGFARGLAVHAGHALVGLSLPRSNMVFTGLPLDERLRASGQAPRCGVAVVELATGRTLHWLGFGNAVQELYDVTLLPGHRRPKLLRHNEAEADRVISFGPLMKLAELERAPAS